MRPQSVHAPGMPDLNGRIDSMARKWRKAQQAQQKGAAK